MPNIKSLHKLTDKQTDSKMHFKLSTAVLATLVGVALSGPLVARDAATILSDLSTIKTDINTLTQHFNEFTGDLLQALAAQAVEQQLESDIDQATADAKATSALSAADSTSVTNALLGLKPDIVTSLDAIVAKVLPSLLCRWCINETNCVETAGRLRRRGQPRPLGPEYPAEQDGCPVRRASGYCHCD